MSHNLQSFAGRHRELQINVKSTRSGNSTVDLFICILSALCRIEFQTRGCLHGILWVMNAPTSLKFCPACGKSTTDRIPEGDNRQRQVCDHCDFINYQNPKNVVGCILGWEEKVLLCKRAIEPRYGYWTLPAGFMENRETSMQGAAREAFEEANATAENLKLFGLYNLPRISQIYIMFHGDLKDGYIATGEESLDVALFAREDIPWDELAFPVVTESLQRYFEERPNHQVHVADIKGRPGADIEIIRYD